MPIALEPAFSNAAIAIRALVKQYHHRPVLDRLDLTLQDGDFCILVGANGAGKTTLLRILATLVRPNQGKVLFQGRPLDASTDIRQSIGYIGHQTMFYADLTALENLQHYASLYGVAQPQTRIAEGIQDAGLAHVQNQPVRTFSRGMLQRLSITRALLHDPKILLFDEPYTGLDQEAAQWLDQQLQNLHTPGKVIFVAAHRPQRLIRLASHIAWLQNGVITHHMPAEALNTSPKLLAYLQEVP